MNEKRSDSFQNYVVLTGEISNIERKQSKEGKDYITAHGMITTDFNREPMPVKVIALNGSCADLTEGRATLIGRLGYEQHSTNEDVSSGIIIFLHRVEPYPLDGKPRNIALFTLRLGETTTPKVAKNGKIWAQSRAALGQGKDKSGAYKPSFWMNLKAFTSRDGDRAAPLALGTFQKGDLVNVTGRISYELYHSKPSFNVMATKIEPFDAMPVNDPAVVSA